MELEQKPNFLRSKGDQLEQRQGSNMFNTHMYLDENTINIHGATLLKSTCIGIIKAIERAFIPIDVCLLK